MAYSVKEIYITLQGEGVHTGRPAVFLRFAGCNLWDGLEVHRDSAVCRFCDTDFVGVDGEFGGRYARASVLAGVVRQLWASRDVSTADEGHLHSPDPFVVCTGGEPLLQLDSDLIDELHRRGFEIAVETNGTVQPPRGIDWLCVSPKAGAELVVTSGDELKLVFPQDMAQPEKYANLDFRFFSLQPMDGPRRAENTWLALDYCLQHTRWRLSIQTHKILGIP